MISERIQDSDGTIIYPSRSVAYKLKIGRNQMLKRLRDVKMLDSNNHPVKYDRALYRAHSSVHNGLQTICTYFTDKAIDIIREKCIDIPKIKMKTIDNSLPNGLLELLNGR